MASPIKIDYVADWTARLRSRLYTQFRGLHTWELWIGLLARQFQDLEDSGQTLFGVYDIDNSSGVQLDAIGLIVGQARNGLDDATYRLYLKARIVANRSTGSPEEIYAVFRALLGLIGFVITTDVLGIKAFKVRIKSAITRAQALAALDFLRDSKEAAARAILHWQETDDTNLFRFDIGPGFDVGLFAGVLQA